MEDNPLRNDAVSATVRNAFVAADTRVRDVGSQTHHERPAYAKALVISDALVASLLPDELATVLAHEREHDRGRHHLVLALLDVVVAPLRWLPLMSVIVGAVPHYLEIAADDAARRCTGTPALASALARGWYRAGD